MITAEAQARSQMLMSGTRDQVRAADPLAHQHPLNVSMQRTLEAQVNAKLRGLLR